MKLNPRVPMEVHLLNASVQAQETVEAKRQVVAAAQEATHAAIDDSLKHQPALMTFYLLDAVKTVVSRELVIQRRRENCVSLELQEMVSSLARGGKGIWLIEPEDDYVESMIADERDVCAVNFYQSPTNAFWAAMAYWGDDTIEAELIPLATGDVGRSLHSDLLELSRSKLWAVPSETERFLFPILRLFGGEIIPRLQRLPSVKRLMLIPHRLLHALPLHLMMMTTAGGTKILDEVVEATTYVPSVYCFRCRGKHNSPDRPPPPVKPLLACVDVDCLNESATLELSHYRLFAHTSGEECDLVEKPERIPDDLSPYRVQIWSCHGGSDPSTWCNNSLFFGARRFSSQCIVDGWNLRNAEYAILSACETGVDRSLDPSLDEYIGLDMAFHIAGAQAVLSTMWRAEQYAAAVMTTQLLEGIMRNARVSEYLRLNRFLHITGKWHDAVELFHAQQKQQSYAPPHLRALQLSYLERLLDIPRDAFRHISRWGVFRCFGGW